MEVFYFIATILGIVFFYLFIIVWLNLNRHRYNIKKARQDLMDGDLLKDRQQEVIEQEKFLNKIDNLITKLSKKREQ